MTEQQDLSPLEQAIQAGREKAQSTLDKPVQDVGELLGLAGVNQLKIQELIANPSMVALIGENPDLAQQLAKQFPSTHTIDYYESRQQMGFDFAPTPVRPEGFYSATDPTFSDTGSIEYPGGIIANMEQGVVKFPPNNASVAGSPAWFAQVPKWSDEKVETWRERLFKSGYLESKKGGRDVDFMQALQQYQTYRYLYGGGNPIDLTSAQSSVTKKDFGAMNDPAVLRSEVREWYQGIYGTDPDPEEADYWAEKMSSKMMRQARRKGLDPTDAAAVARARTQEKFLADPEVQLLREQDEDEAVNTHLADSIVTMAQTIGA